MTKRDMGLAPSKFLTYPQILEERHTKVLTSSLFWYLKIYLEPFLVQGNSLDVTISSKFLLPIGIALLEEWNLYFSISTSSNFRNSLPILYLYQKKKNRLSGFLVHQITTLPSTNILLLSTYILSKSNDSTVFRIIIISINFSTGKAFYFIFLLHLWYVLNIRVSYQDLVGNWIQSLNSAGESNSAC